MYQLNDVVLLDGHPGRIWSRPLHECASIVTYSVLPVGALSMKQLVVGVTPERLRAV